MVFPYEYYKQDKDNYFLNGGGRRSSGGNGTSDGCCKEHLNFRTQLLIWRIISGIMGVFFFAAAFVQYNDPDPYIWMLAYVIPCIVSWAVAFGLTLKEYSRVPSTPETASQTDSNGSSSQFEMVNWNDSPVKRRVGLKKPKPVEADVVIPRYGSTNTKLNWLINIHIIYCFALGLWTLWVHLLRGTGAGEKVTTVGNRTKVVTARIMSRQLQMDPGTEEAKELMGLCLVIAWLSLLRHNNYVLLGKIGIVTAATLTFAPFIAWACVEMFEGSDDYATRCI